MEIAPLSRRDRLRQILADLQMPGALEALDATLRLQAAMRSRRLPAVTQLRDFDFTFQPAIRADREFARARLR